MHYELEENKGNLIILTFKYAFDLGPYWQVRVEENYHDSGGTWASPFHLFLVNWIISKQISQAIKLAWNSCFNVLD